MATTATGYAVADIGDVKHGEATDGRVRHQVRTHFGIEGFGVNAFRAVEAGAQVINEHDEGNGLAGPGQQELYVVLTGKARFTIDGDEVDAPAGTVLYVEPRAKRGAVADEPDTTVLVVGGSPGVAYNQTPGYLVGPMFGPYGENDFEGAAEIVRGVLSEHPGLPIGLYNLACCEARLGENDSSLEHLEQAIAGDSGFAALARSDGDFESLRENPRFKELVG